MNKLKALLMARDIRRHKVAHINHHVFSDVRILGTPKPSDIIAFLTVRNEMLRLPDFLRHHRTLGVDRFVILDNASADGSVDYLVSQPDVDVITTSNSYSEAYSGTYWREILVNRYGFNRWYLILDADELLVYDGAPHRDLHQLAEHLTKWKAKSFPAPLIDMYSEKPMTEVSYSPGDSMLATCRYFDGKSYLVQKDRDGHVVSIYGGPRSRVFTKDGKPFENAIEKYPFLFWDRTLWRKNIHHLSIYNDRRGPCGALLHFKDLGDFKTKVANAVREKQHYRASTEYFVYHNALNDGSLTSFMYEGSVEYTGTRSLIDAGLMGRIFWDMARPTDNPIKGLLTGRPLRSALKQIHTPY